MFSCSKKSSFFSFFKSLSLNIFPIESKNKESEIKLSDVGGLGFEDDDENYDEFKRTPEHKKTNVSSLNHSDRLSQSSFNDLFHGLKNDNFIIKVVETGRIQLNPAEPNLDYFIVEKKPSSQVENKENFVKKIVLFNLVKDSDTEENEKNLPTLSSIIDVLRKHKFNESSGAKLLLEEEANESLFVIPVRQCRGFFSNRGLFSSSPFFKAAHIVLVVYDASNRFFNVYDSQGYNIPFLYPDKIWDKSAYVRYAGATNLGVQKSDHLCGYYVHNWMRFIAVTGSVEGIEKLQVSPDLVRSKEFYLKNWLSISNQIIELDKKSEKADIPVLDAHKAEVVVQNRDEIDEFSLLPSSP